MLVNKYIANRITAPLQWEVPNNPCELPGTIVYDSGGQRQISSCGHAARRERGWLYSSLDNGTAPSLFSANFDSKSFFVKLRTWHVEYVETIDGWPETYENNIYIGLNFSFSGYTQLSIESDVPLAQNVRLTTSSSDVYANNRVNNNFVFINADNIIPVGTQRVREKRNLTIPQILAALREGRFNFD